MRQRPEDNPYTDLPWVFWLKEPETWWWYRGYEPGFPWGFTRLIVDDIGAGRHGPRGERRRLRRRGLGAWYPGNR